MLDEKESPSWLQDPKHLAQDLVQVGNRAQDQGGENCINAFIGEREGFGHSPDQ